MQVNCFASCQHVKVPMQHKVGGQIQFNNLRGGITDSGTLATAN